VAELLGLLVVFPAALGLHRPSGQLTDNYMALPASVAVVMVPDLIEKDVVYRLLVTTITRGLEDAHPYLSVMTTLSPVRWHER